MCVCVCVCVCVSQSLKSLDLSRCVGLKAEALLMLGHLNKLTDLTMTGLKLPGKTPHTPQLNADLEKWLTLLKRIQVRPLPLSHTHTHTWGACERMRIQNGTGLRGKSSVCV